MAEIELVIKIDESKLWSLKNEPIEENFNIYELASYIHKGIQLPKGHGRLIDEKEVYKKFYCRCLAEVAKEVLEETPTIIKADQESEG